MNQSEIMGKVSIEEKRKSIYEEEKEAQWTREERVSNAEKD